VDGQLHAPAALPPRKSPGTNCTMRSSGIQGQSEWVRKISPTLGFELQTVRPAASCYTNTLTRPPIRNANDKKKRNIGGKDAIQYQFINHKSHIDSPCIEPGPPHWKADDKCSFKCHMELQLLTTNTCHIRDTEQPVNVVYCAAHTCGQMSVFVNGRHIGSRHK
jgi:hypothetical protein